MYASHSPVPLAPRQMRLTAYTPVKSNEKASMNGRKPKKTEPPNFKSSPPLGISPWDSKQGLSIIYHSMDDGTSGRIQSGSMIVWSAFILRFRMNRRVKKP